MESKGQNYMESLAPSSDILRNKLRQWSSSADHLKGYFWLFELGLYKELINSQYII